MSCLELRHASSYQIKSGVVVCAKNKTYCISRAIVNLSLGAKERSEIMEAFHNIYPILKNFKKT